MRGTHPFFLFHNPNPQKPLHDIFEGINKFTDEIFEGDDKLYHNVSTFFPLLPTVHEGKFVKGVLFSHAHDLLVARYPWLQTYFHTFAYAMYSSFARAKLADGFMVPYHNPEYNAWFRQKNPDQAHKPIVGLDDSDYINEMQMQPADVEEPKLYDVLVVARLDISKNLPVFAESLKAYRRMYPGKQLRVMLKVPDGVNLNFTKISDQMRGEMRKVSQILGFYPDWLYLASTSIKDMSKLYRRAKCVVMCSLAEGKNRSIHEAMACNIPVVTFADFNKFVRGPTPIFGEGGGMTAPAFTPESLASTIHTVIHHPQRFKPRETVLKYSGRQMVLEQLMRACGSYYPETLGGAMPKRYQDHPHLTAAFNHTYGVAHPDHLFGRRGHIGPSSHMLGLDKICRALEQLQRIMQERGFVGVAGIEPRASAEAARI